MLLGDFLLYGYLLFTVFGVSERLAFNLGLLESTRPIGQLLIKTVKARTFLARDDVMIETDSLGHDLTLIELKL